MKHWLEKNLEDKKETGSICEVGYSRDTNIEHPPPPSQILSMGPNIEYAPEEASYIGGHMEWQRSGWRIATIAVARKVSRKPQL